VAKPRYPELGGRLPSGTRVAKHLALLTMQRVRKPGDVRRTRVGRAQSMSDTAPVGSHVQLHPKVPGVALAGLRGLFHLGAARNGGVLGGTRRRNDGGAYDGARPQP
jgi:hypothetical protein